MGNTGVRSFCSFHPVIPSRLGRACLLVIASVTCSASNATQARPAILCLTPRTRQEVDAFEDIAGLLQEDKVSFIWLGVRIHRGIHNVHIRTRKELLIRTFLTDHALWASDTSASTCSDKKIMGWLQHNKQTVIIHHIINIFDLDLWISLALIFSRAHLVCRNLCHTGTLIEVLRDCPHRSKVGRSSQGKCTCPHIPPRISHQPFGII